MRKIFIWFFFLSFSATYLLAQSTDNEFSGKISAEVIVNKTTVPLNDTLRVDFQIHFEGKQDEIRLIEPAIPEVTGFAIIGSGSSNDVKTNSFIKNYYYYLLPKTIGMGYIEPIKVEYLEKATETQRQLGTKRISIEVTAPVEKEKTSYVAAIILVILLIIVGLISIMIYRKKVSENEKLNKTEENQLSVQEQTHDKLENISKSKISNKEKIEKISNVILSYLKIELGLDKGLTGREVVQKLRKEGQEDSVLFDIQDFFDKSDMIKFSGNNVELNETEETIFKAKEILNMDLKGN